MGENTENFLIPTETKQECQMNDKKQNYIRRGIGTYQKLAKKRSGVRNICKKGATTLSIWNVG